MESSDFHRIEQLFTELVELAPEKRVERLNQIRAASPEIARQLSKLLDAQDDASSTADHSASVWSKVAPILENEFDNGILIDRYEIVSVIGRGGMGTVYRAVRNDIYRQDVAIKVLRANTSDQISLRRFNQERQVLAKMSHPGIARILDGGTTHDGRLYYVMEIVEGLELKEWLQSQNPTLDQRLNCFVQIAEAVAYAHKLLIIHRDIKPQNIRIDTNGQPKLLDFGIAKQMEAESDTSMTLTRARVYSPEYASPEQIRGDTLSTAVDVYGLGVLLYMMLAGASPYKTRGMGLHDVEQSILNDEPMRLSQGSESGDQTPPYDKNQLRGDLDAIALKAIRKEPELRYGSVRQFIDDIVRYLNHQPVHAREGNRQYRVKKFLRRNKYAVGSGLVIFMLVLGISIVSSYSVVVLESKNREITAERDRAQAMSDFMLSVFRSGNPFSDQDPNLTARQLLDIGLSRIDAKFASNPDLAIHMKYPIASAFKGIGLITKADSVYNHLYHQIRQHKPNGSLDELEVLFEIAVIRDIQGDYRGADSLHKLIQSNARQWGLQNSPKVMEAYAEHAIMNVKLNRPVDEFQTQLPLNIQLLKQNGHGGSYAHITSLLSLGSSYYYTDPKLGIPFLEEADSLYRSAGLQESTQTLMLTNNLALFYQNSGNIVKADTSYKKLLRLVNTYMSDNSGYVSTVYTNYATFLNEQGRQDEALEALKKAYDVQIEGGNPSDNNMLIIYGNFGVVNQEQGNHKKALENFEKAYEIGLRMVGENHEFMAMIHTYNGISLAHLGLTQRAKDEIQRGYEMRIRLGGEQNWSLSASEYALAELSVLESNFDEAASHLLKSISYLRSIYDANHQLVLKSTDRLLEVYIKAGKNDLAQTYADNFLVDLKNADGSIQSQLDRYEFIKSYLVLK